MYEQMNEQMYEQAISFLETLFEPYRAMKDYGASLRDTLSATSLRGEACFPETAAILASSVGGRD